VKTDTPHQSKSFVTVSTEPIGPTRWFLCYPFVNTKNSVYWTPKACK